jgi:hypothetical protein
MVYQRLESSGLFTATRALGLSDREAVSAMMGSKAARTQLALALRTNTSLTKEQKAALEAETGAVGASRLAQLKHNVAVAAAGPALDDARAALKKFMDAPANKRLSITGVEGAKAQIDSLNQALRDLWSNSKGPRTSGPGGISVLLNPGASHHAVGTRRFAGGTTWVGERGPELVNLPGGSSILDHQGSLNWGATMSAGRLQFEPVRVDLALNGQKFQQILLEHKRLTGNQSLGFD